MEFYYYKLSWYLISLSHLKSVTGLSLFCQMTYEYFVGMHFLRNLMHTFSFLWNSVHVELKFSVHSVCHVTQIAHEWETFCRHRTNRLGNFHTTGKRFFLVIEMLKYSDPLLFTADSLSPSHGQNRISVERKTKEW